MNRGPEKIVSYIDRAAALPPEAPHILGVNTSVPVRDPEAAAAVIDIDELEDSLRDPVRQAFAAEAIAYRQRLEEKSRTIDDNDAALRSAHQ